MIIIAFLFVRCASVMNNVYEQKQNEAVEEER